MSQIAPRAPAAPTPASTRPVQPSAATRPAPEKPATPQPQPPPQAEPEKPEFVVESAKRLSDSLIWRMQREGYTRRAQTAWAPDAVPFYITSNAYIAAAYARVVQGYLRDCVSAQAPPLGPFDREAPVYVLELAAGSGQFAYLFLKKLLPALREVPALAGVRFRYVMSDLVAGNVEAWRTRERLRPFVEEGVLDFARFDIEQDREVKLLASGETLSPKTLKNPLAVIGNYTFDTTAQDAFWMKDGKLHEGLVSLVSNRKEEPPVDPTVVSRATLRFEQRPVSTDYYEDKALNAVLAHYAERLGNTSLLFPIGALKGIRSLMALSRDRLLVLSGDKGYTHEDELVARGDPQLAVHGGDCFSMMVNYHAIGLYFRERGGQPLHAATRDKRLKVSAFLQGGPGAAWPETASAFRQATEGFSPCDYFTLATEVRKQLPAATLEVILALLRLGEWDAHLLYNFSSAIAEQAKSAPDHLRQELVRALERCWEHWYPMSQDVPFEIGRIYGALERPVDALRFYDESLRLYKEHPATLFNAGLCRYRLQQPKEALALMERALRLKPDYAPAREWRLRIQGELAQAGR